MAKKLWHKRENETAQQYKAFQCYYLLDPAARSIKMAIAEYNKDAGREVGGGNSQFSYWSAQHDWVLRAEAFDEHRFRLRENAALRGTEKGAEEAAVNLEYMRAELAERFDKIGEGADELLERILNNPEEYSIKLAEVSGLQRVRLDIYRALSKNEKSNERNNDPLAELSRMLGE